MNSYRLYLYLPFRKLRIRTVKLWAVVLLCVFSVLYLTIQYRESKRFIRITKLPTPGESPAPGAESPAPRESNFQLVLPFVEPKLSYKDLYVAVVVNSAATSEKSRELRTAIRRTWGKLTTQNRNNSWKVFFVMGISDNTIIHKTNLQEALHNNDVIIGNFIDIYDNIAIKTFMSHFWVTSILSSKYVLKTDDDVYVRVPKLIKWLEEAGSPQPFYGGYVSGDLKPIRDPTSKWFISEKQFNETKWPPFCHGAFHVLSTDILPKYFNYTRYIRKPFHTDDAYLGVVARDLNVSATRIPGFNLEFWYKTRSDCELMSSTAMGHLLDVHNMMEYYSYYKHKTATQFNVSEGCL